MMFLEILINLHREKKTIGYNQSTLTANLYTIFKLFLIQSDSPDAVFRSLVTVGPIWPDFQIPLTVIL